MGRRQMNFGKANAPHAPTTPKPWQRQPETAVAPMSSSRRNQEHAGRFRGISTKSRRGPLKSLPMQVRLGSSESTPGIILYLFRAGSLDWTSFAPPRPAIMVCFAIETHAIDQANAQPRTRMRTCGRMALPRAFVTYRRPMPCPALPRRVFAARADRR